MTTAGSSSFLEHDLRSSSISGTSPWPRLDPISHDDKSSTVISIVHSDFEEGVPSPGTLTPSTQTPLPRKASQATPSPQPSISGTPIAHVVDDRDVPERVSVLDDQLSPMVGRAVKFSFAIKENKHHTPQHSENYRTSFRFRQKSTIRQRPPRRDSLEVIRQDHARQALTQKCLEVMAKGCIVTKYNRFGNPCRRIVTVDKEGTELKWESSFEHESRKKGIGFMAKKPRLRQLADITGVIYSSLVEFAHRKSRFFHYNQQGNPPWLCLTVLFDQETLDLVFKTEEEVDTWFFGLQNLAPMSKFYLPRGPQLIFRAQLKIEHLSKQLGKPIMGLLVDLLKQAKQAVKKETEEREKEEKLAKVVIEGMLKKKSPKEVLGKHMWQSRWFRLEQTPDYMHSRLLYYKEKDGELLGNIPVSNIRAVTVPEKKKRDGRFDIELKGGMMEEQRMFALIAAEESTAHSWKDSLEQLMKLINEHSPQSQTTKFWNPYLLTQEIPEDETKQMLAKSSSSRLSQSFSPSTKTSGLSREESEGTSLESSGTSRSEAEEISRRRLSSGDQSQRQSSTFLLPSDRRSGSFPGSFPPYIPSPALLEPSLLPPTTLRPSTTSLPISIPVSPLDTRSTTPFGVPSTLHTAIPPGVQTSPIHASVPSGVQTSTLHTAIPFGVQTNLTFSMVSPPLIKPSASPIQDSLSTQQFVRPTIIKPTPSMNGPTRPSPIPRPSQTGPPTPPLGSGVGSGTFPLLPSSSSLPSSGSYTSAPRTTTEGS